MIKDQVLDALSTLGFIPEPVGENIGYRFEYDGLLLLYRIEDEDSSCVTLSVPNIFDVTDANRLSTLNTLMKLTEKMMYIQPNIMFGDQVWLTYQHYLGENPATPDLLEHMIRVVAASTFHFQKFINENSSDNEE